MTHDRSPDRSLRTHLIAGGAALALLCGGVGGWAATTELVGAIVATGSLVVDSNVKKVQHLTGGIVGEIRVRDGDRVAAGDILLRLDETITRSNLAVITNSLDELSARRGRLEAERDGLAAIKVRAELQARAADPEIAALISGERRLFELRGASRSGLVAQLRERIEQLREQIDGVREQVNAKGEEIKLIRDELTGLEALWRKNLVPISRVTLLRREATRLQGERGQLLSAMAQAKGKISETELQILQIDQDLRSEVAKELREMEAKRSELTERRVAAEDQLKRVDVRAPQTGVVHQLAVHTVGGVVSPGDVMMQIVPEADKLAIEVRVAPDAIDQLSIGQPALLRFSAFSQRTTPEITGSVSRIAADLTTDDTRGPSYYTVRISADEDEMSKLGGVQLVAGMPVEAFIRTGERTALSYLLKPISDQVSRAFREE